MSGAKAAETHKEHKSMHLRDVAFRIEDRVFRLPIQMFEQSKMFCAILEKAALQDPDAQHSIPSDGIRMEDFLQFLRFIYQRPLVGPTDDRNAATYTALLKVTTKWRFLKIRERVICDFPEIPLTDKFILSKDCCVQEWFISSLHEYVKLGRSMTLKDVETLGSDYALKILQVRDTLTQVQPKSHRRSMFDEYKFDPQFSLTSLFHEEIKQSRFEPSSVIVSKMDDFNLVDMYFLVENQLFKSYRQCFEASPVFQEMFSLPIESKKPDGHSKSQPLRLEGISRVDFAPFVDLINPGTSVDIEFSLAELLSILKLSSMWEFNRTRQYAILEISKLKPHISPAQQIHLAKTYLIQDWLLPALDDYMTQAELITAQDVDLLGWPYIIKIRQARDEKERCYGGSGTLSRQTYDFNQVIRLTFADEIRRSKLYGNEL